MISNSKRIIINKSKRHSIRQKPIRCRRPLHVYSIHTYYDKVDEYSNREFYLYTLGRYHNKTIYCYGETSDIFKTELALKSTFPIYKKIISYPIEDNLLAKNEFETYISQYKTNIPVVNASTNIDVFTLSDTNVSLRSILEKLHTLYNKQSSESSRLIN